MGKVKTENSLILPIFAAVIITACNLPGSAFLSIFGITITAGTLFFPLAFILFDLNTYFYGAKTTRKALLYITLSQTFVFAMTWLISIMSGTDVYHMSLRVITGSIIAFFVSSTIDVNVFSQLNTLFSNKRLWASVNISNLLSQFIDTFIFSLVVFVGVLSLNQIIVSGALMFLIKILSGIVLTPCLYLIKSLLGLKRNRIQ